MKRDHRKTKNRLGFTLLEVLLAISVFAVMVGLTAPIFQSFQVKNDLDIAAEITAQTLRRAQALSRSGEGDSSWGFKAQIGSLVLFKGNNYLGRESSFDEVFELPSTISCSGNATEVVFDKLTGFPINIGNIILSTSNNTRTIILNEKGMVSY
ncbi:MAG TPA: type II secretion system protein [Patescibacteria group bacterium]|nr:type II secretion system protein [Patescibacteria group bacterium]